MLAFKNPTLLFKILRIVNNFTTADWILSSNGEDTTCNNTNFQSLSFFMPDSNRIFSLSKRKEIIIDKRLGER